MRPSSNTAHVTIYPADYDRVDEAVERAFEAYGPEVRGRAVLVKPNLLTALGPERHATTHPAVVRAVIKALERRGAGRIMVGDNSGMAAYGYGEFAARTAGILQVAGPYYVNLGISPVTRPVACEFAPTLAFSREVFEADLIISLPKMKTHVATGITGAVKNSFGYVVGAEKTRLHRAAVGPENFARAIVDVFQVRPPDLVIMDAVVAMEGQGPATGRPRQVGRLLASADAVALDVVMAAMMGLDAARVPTLRIAAARGLGPADLAAIRIDGPMEVVRGFRVPPIGMRLGALAARLASVVIVARPEVRLDRCTRCGSCVQACPVEAITETPRGPVIDQSRCIRCFCCHEMCRYKAIHLARRMRLFHRLGH